MRIIYCSTDITDQDRLVLNKGALSYGGQTFENGIEHYLNHHESIPQFEELYLPLHPCLADLACAYLIDTVSKSHKMPRAAGMLCDFLKALPERELPFSRDSIDTLPIIHEYLLTCTKDENDAVRATDIIFSILRQFMMDMLLFEGMDIATTPVSAKIPAAQPIKADAEGMLDRYISDCHGGREHTCKLPMHDGELEQRRILILNRPTCACPELFARLCGFSMLICCNGTAEVHTLDCSFDAIRCAAKSAHILNGVSDTTVILNSENDVDGFIAGFDNSECKSCSIVYTANVNAPKRIIRNMQPSYSFNSMPLGVDIKMTRGKITITLTQAPELSNTHFYHAMKKALQVRSELLDIDLSELFNCPVTVKSKTCDLFIDLPADCMEDFYAVSIKSEGGNFALLSDGAVCLWDKIPPLNEMRQIMSEISRLELTVLKNPLHAASILEKATDISIKITSGKGFIKEALVGSNADKHADDICKSAAASAIHLNVRRSRAVIICASALISLALCTFPFVTGFIAPTPDAIIPTVAVAALLFGIVLFLFIKIPSFKTAGSQKDDCTNDDVNAQDKQDS